MAYYRLILYSCQPFFVIIFNLFCFYSAGSVILSPHPMNLLSQKTGFLSTFFSFFSPFFSFYLPISQLLSHIFFIFFSKIGFKRTPNLAGASTQLKVSVRPVCRSHTQQVRKAIPRRVIAYALLCSHTSSPSRLLQAKPFRKPKHG